MGTAARYRGNAAADQHVVRQLQAASGRGNMERLEHSAKLMMAIMRGGGGHNDSRVAVSRRRNGALQRSDVSAPAHAMRGTMNNHRKLQRQRGLSLFARTHARTC